PELLTYFINRVELVGRVFIGTKDAEGIHVCLHHIAEEDTKGAGILGFSLSRLFESDSIFTEIWQTESVLQQSTVSVRIGSHATCACWRQLFKFRNQRSVFVEQFLGF